MKIFIDSADLEEIKEAYTYGIIDGVTTNPSLIHKAVSKRKKINMKNYVNEILTVAKGTPVSLEVTETTYTKMVAEGKKLYELFNPTAKNVYIKIPIHTSTEREANTDGLRAIKTLKNTGIPINCTLVFTPEQALLAAKAGADFISPFVGRIDDYIRQNNNIHFNKTDYFPSYGWNNSGRLLEDNGIISGVDLIRQCKEIIKQAGLKSEVLAASLRNTRQVREVALVGADIATLPLGVIKQLLIHDKTSEGMRGFIKDTVPDYQKL